VLLPVPAKSNRRSGNFWESLRRRVARVERRALAQLRRDGFNTVKARVERRLEARYRGQSYERAVPFTLQFPLAFHREHERAYGYSDPERPLEVVNIRVRVVIPTPKPRFDRQRLAAESSPRDALIQTKSVWFEGRSLATPFYDRGGLRAGVKLRGPAVVTEYSSTTVVPPGFTCRVDEYCNLVLTASSLVRSS
jgi:N-methylhydantoinase A